MLGEAPQFLVLVHPPFFHFCSHDRYFLKNQHVRLYDKGFWNRTSYFSFTDFLFFNRMTRGRLFNCSRLQNSLKGICPNQIKGAVAYRWLKRVDITDA